MGHTMSIHSRNDQVILEFGLKKPAGRIVVNTPTTHGSIGLTTGLDPAMTLGCGGWGGNITSDNISPRHLLNIKRLAYEITPAVVRPASRAAGDRARRPQLPKAAGGPPPAGRDRGRRLARRIDEFLTSRGIRPPAGAAAQAGRQAPASVAPTSAPRGTARATGGAAEKPADFVCEDDVGRPSSRTAKL